MSVIPFAGGDGPSSVLSELYGAHSVGEGIFGFITTADATPLRLLCREMREAIAVFPWWDEKTRIPAKRLPSWRAAFPAARAAVVVGALGPAEWRALGGARRDLQSLTVAGCSGVTDARLAEFTPHLVNLDARLCRDVTYEGLEALPHPRLDRHARMRRRRHSRGGR
jgi:hypothetical protein